MSPRTLSLICAVGLIAAGVASACGSDEANESNRDATDTAQAADGVAPGDTAAPVDTAEADSSAPEDTAASDTSEADTIVGICAAAIRESRPVNGRTLSAFYGGDLKLAPEARGRGVARKLFWSGLRLAFFSSALPRWGLACGAAMRGERGDLRRTFRGQHPGRMASPLAVLSVFFEPPPRLRALDDGPGPPGDGSTSVGRAPAPRSSATSAPRSSASSRAGRAGRSSTCRGVPPSGRPGSARGCVRAPAPSPTMSSPASRSTSA